MPASDSASPLYATCASGLDVLLAAELEGLGLAEVRRAGAGASFGGGLEAGYRACLGSRVANRVLMVLHAGPAASPEALYERVREIDWNAHLDVDGTLAVDLFTAKSAITHSRYGALKVKDAIVDQFRDRFGRRPSVDRDTPDVRVNVYLFRDRARIALDLSGSGLHRRGYREEGGAAPLKENLAAALLLAADWPAACEAGQAFADPLCGSGTLLIEAAMIACRRAPGLGRAHFGFLGWRGHDAPLWERLVGEARAAVRPSPVPIAGGDHDARSVEATRRHAASAGVGEAVSLERRALGEGRLSALEDAAPGLVLTNPPYGERLAAGENFYREFGKGLSTHYDGWRLGVFTACSAPLGAASLPLDTRLSIANGGIDCVFAEGRVPSWSGARPLWSGWGSASRRNAPSPDAASSDAGSNAVSDIDAPLAPASPSAGPPSDIRSTVDVAPFANRLRKNVKALRGWLRQEGIAAWRAYDADLPEFALAIDVYESASDGRHLVVQEYRAPASVNAALAAARLDAALAALPALMDVARERVHLKVREPQRGANQYGRDGRGESVVAVLEERGCRLELNFSDYLDVGLFPDHRNVRLAIAERARGARFLNLFAYTGAATVAAVVGGARESVSVDLSNRYCRWAERNLALNRADRTAHRVVRSDVGAWLAAHTGAGRGAGRVGGGDGDTEPFELILLDPPTFSNSTDTEADWNVQRDHAATIGRCLDLLAPEGLLIFSNNFRRFRLDDALEAGQLGSRRLRVEERSRWSIGRDYRRSPRIHRVWFIERDEAGSG